MTSNEKRLRGMLGFAMRAGKVTIGTDAVCSALGSKKKPKLVVIASDVSDSTRKKIFTKCEFYKVKAVQINIGADELGDLLGKTYSPATAGITDEGFAEQIDLITSACNNVVCDDEDSSPSSHFPK